MSVVKAKDTSLIDDPNCVCHQIEAEINRKFPNADWNIDMACDEWHARRDEIPDNEIEFEDGDDKCYACVCPRCGRTICGWCV